MTQPPLLTDQELELLSRLESLELPTLSWGIIDTSLSREEVSAAIEDSLEKAEDYTTSPDDVLAQLERSALIIAVETDPTRYRTRFAEAVRLFARLRQLFPPHLQNGTWPAAPELVTDFRVLSRPRRFPRRDVDPATTIDTAVDLLEPARRPLARDVLGTLLHLDGGEPRQLAQFQAESLRHMLGAVGEARNTGTIVTAGTGSGKTLAFYMPAFVEAATRIDSGPNWTKVVAIYPRVELLKDQLADAVGHAQRLRPILEKHKCRTLRIGAFFGSTPYNSRATPDRFGWSEQKGRGWISPFLVCWSCGGPTLWPGQQREAGIEILECVNCGASTHPGEVALTRDAMRASPPDILFTTTEMINRNLSSSQYGPIFGLLNRAHPPRMALLDEAHAYSGTTGAQTALLLRRWLHGIRAPIHVVGLSATLDDAQAFFSRLTNIAESNVATIGPREEELYDRGAEYLLALRGNPMSGAALLSTTIQALMLLRRIEDVSRTVPTHGVFPPRVFAFTDDLDITNRLYSNLLDAEGRTRWNRPIGNSLAALRRPVEPELARRRRDGQVWDLPAQIGHQLGGSTVSVSRTTSRDVGVDQGSDIVVATASLEVGFDDVGVGSVLQHKAPRDTASFIQRRGRAGRQQHARPWAVVVLSDFGRDRRAYQSFHSLFDPTLRPNALPIDNRHVLKIQAAYSLLDWLARQMGGLQAGSLWRDLAEPQSYAPAQSRQARAAALLRGLLANPQEVERLGAYLARALGLTQDEVEIALWESPRALILNVIPTLLRRLETQWRSVTSPPLGDRQGRDPLPEFVPPNLFGELNTPEVQLELPGRNVADAIEAVSVGQALRELTPGRVTLRFSRADEARTRHWVPLPDHGTDVDIGAFVLDSRDLGQVPFEEAGILLSAPCIRPWRARLSVPPPGVPDSQTAGLSWSQTISPPEEAAELDLPSAHSWRKVLAQLAFFTHSARTEVSILRFALGGYASDPAHPERERSFIFVRGADSSQERVVLGYDGTYDAVRLRLRLPSSWELTAEPSRALRRRYFDWLVERSEFLADRSTGFSRGWLAVLYRAAITAASSAQGATASDARNKIRQAGVGPSLEKAMRVIFEVTGSTGAQTDDTRAEKRLLDLLHDSAVTDELHKLGNELVSDTPLPESFLSELYQVTVAAVFRDAFAAIAPTADVDPLIIDIDQEAVDKGFAEIWLSERTVGGGGAVEQLLKASVADPRRLLRLAEVAAGASDFEMTDEGVRELLDRVRNDDQLAGALARYREAGEAPMARTALLRLREVAGRLGLHWTHAIGSTLANRVRRPGSSADTDELTVRLHTRWSELEEGLGFEVDARVVAYALRDELDVESAVGLTPPQGRESEWRFSQLYSLLWPRGYEARTATLSSYSPFARLAEPERLLVEPLLERAYETVRVDAVSWRAEVDAALARDGTVVLAGARTDRRFLKEVLISLSAEPVDLGFLHGFPRVVGVRAAGLDLEITLELEEIA
jgi:hypothetical protein